MYYNCGYSSKMFIYINKGPAYYDDLIDFWVKHYIKSGGVIRNGLVKRRCCEANLWETGEVNFEAWKKWYDKMF
jgi:GH24 family phage-related lysozyme (muramidase)